MAQLLGTDTYRRQVSQNAAARPSGQAVSGELVEVFGTYTVLGTEVSGDVLPLFTLPPGAILRQLFVSTDAVGGTSVLFTEIGDLGDPDRYATTDIPLTAAQTETAMTLLNARAVAPFVVTAGAAQTVTGTITHSGAPTLGKLIVVRGIYRMP